MPRSTKEWIGKTDDAMPGEHVRERLMRIYPACYLCTQPFVDGDKVEIDHKVALRDGGENRESNLRPVHKGCHADKSAKEATDRAAVRKSKLRGFGLQTKAKRPFPKPDKPPRVSRPSLPPRPMFRSVER